MFEQGSSLREALERGGAKRVRLHFGEVPEFILRQDDDKRPRRIALALAVLVHILLFAITFPRLTAEPRQVSNQRAAYAVRQVQFQPPKPQTQQEKPKPKEKRRIIPVPDPTPEEPEPILDETLPAPEVDLDGEIEGIFEIPEGPPGGMTTGVMQIRGNVVPPQKIFYPPPQYTEEGRLARIQGVVILEAIIDAVGDVANVKVLKGLPMGLDQSAVETVKTWKFKPASLNGEPVPVYFNLTVTFSLQ